MCNDRYTVRETEDGPVVERVPHPSEFTGELAGETDNQGRTLSEMLLAERNNDARIEDERLERRLRKSEKSERKSVWER